MDANPTPLPAELLGNRDMTPEEYRDLNLRDWDGDEQEAPQDADMPVEFWKHKGYLLTGLWQHDMDVEALAQATQIQKSTIQTYIDKFEIDTVALKEKLWTKDWPDGPSYEHFLVNAGITPDTAVQMQPMEGVDLDAISAEEAARVHEATTRCTLCGESKRETYRSHPDRVFQHHVFNCGTMLFANGVVQEHNKCAKKQIRNAKTRGN